LHEFAIESIKEEGGIFGAVTTSGNVLTALGVGRGEKSEPNANGFAPKEIDLPKIEA